PGFVEFFTFSIWSPAKAEQAKGSVPDVQLKRGNTVTGRCVGPDGNPVAGAKIEKIFGLEPSNLGKMPTTDVEGRFRLTRPPGAAELIIYSDRWAPRRVSVPASRGGDLGDIRLEAGVELIGHLRESAPGGRPLEGKLIALQSPIAYQSHDGGQVIWAPIRLVCRTDREGNFRIPALK